MNPYYIIPAILFFAIILLVKFLTKKPASTPDPVSPEKFPATTAAAPSAQVAPTTDPTHILDFVKEYWPLALLNAVLIGIYFFMVQFLTSFVEFGYSTVRIGVALNVTFIFLHIIFKHTIRPYLMQGGFAKDFNEALTPTSRVVTTLCVLFAIALLVILCFVHP